MAAESNLDLDLPIDPNDPRKYVCLRVEPPAGHSLSPKKLAVEEDLVTDARSTANMVRLRCLSFILSTMLTCVQNVLVDNIASKSIQTSPITTPTKSHKRKRSNSPDDSSDKENIRIPSKAPRKSRPLTKKHVVSLLQLATSMLEDELEADGRNKIV